jgi:2-dehydro-3-deoxygalactonokinase
MGNSQAIWIAVDWGTTNLRAWSMDGKHPIADAGSDDGMGSLGKPEFEAALISLIEPWLSARHTPVVACGMVGSLQGWVEAPYLSAPTLPLNGAFTRAVAGDPRISVHIVPGIKQTNPADVMRGEETQIAGFLKGEPDFDGVICLPGTHTKWAQISAGEIVSFRTFMTGELFDLIANRSVLRHSVGEGWDAEAFVDAISDTIGRPEALAALLFRLRADDLLSGSAPEAARSRLSGLLIGAELAAARPYWLGQRILLIGHKKLSSHYATALDQQGAQTEIFDATSATLAGLCAALEMIKENLK